MKLSEALRSGRRPDLEQLSLHRYGYAGSLDDTGALVKWLETHPLIDVEVTPEPSATKATRPEQAEFRKLLLEAYDGRCAVTDCDIPETLDAAHLRPWRKGSGVGDGILLRADFHRLLEAKLMTIDRDYVVRLKGGLGLDYERYDGTKIRLPRRVQDRPKI